MSPGEQMALNSNWSLAKCLLFLNPCGVPTLCWTALRMLENHWSPSNHPHTPTHTLPFFSVIRNRGRLLTGNHKVIPPSLTLAVMITQSDYRGMVWGTSKLSRREWRDRSWGAEVLSVASMFSPLSSQKEGTLWDCKRESKIRLLSFSLPPVFRRK